MKRYAVEVFEQSYKGGALHSTGDPEFHKTRNDALTAARSACKPFLGGLFSPKRVVAYVSEWSGTGFAKRIAKYEHNARKGRVHRHRAGS